MCILIKWMLLLVYNTQCSGVNAIYSKPFPDIGLHEDTYECKISAKITPASLPSYIEGKSIMLTYLILVYVMNNNLMTLSLFLSFLLFSLPLSWTHRY